MHSYSRQHPFLTSLALALGSAIALGIARFSYGLLLPVMKADLGWSYLIAGTMNTANALGYLVGALTSPFLMRKITVGRFFLWACLITGLFLMLSGFTGDTFVLFVYRVLAGVASAWIFVAGGVLISQLAHLNPTHSGLLLGIFYGGPGFGIVLCSLFLPEIISYATESRWTHAWQFGWLGLAAVCGLMTVLLAKPVLSIPAIPTRSDSHIGTPLRRYALVLAGYFMFGVGYIGYMTFIVALLKEMGLSPFTLYTFYAMLGLAVMLSSRIWAGFLQKHRSGMPLATLNALLGLACLIPALIAMTRSALDGLMMIAIFASGLLFGAVFLSAVASTTAFVKHNLPAADWVGGITAFTSIFAAGQIIGPTVIGWVSDGTGGLAVGLLISGAALWFGALIAVWQKPLT